ncbi:hypothetical protein STEG23_023466 [Scotinomys teguina]
MLTLCYSKQHCIENVSAVSLRYTTQYSWSSTVEHIPRGLLAPSSAAPLRVRKLFQTDTGPVSQDLRSVHH